MEEVRWADDIRRIMNAAGNLWFDADSMRFFGTRLCRAVYHGPGGIYFVTTEQPPHGQRRASVRQFYRDEAGKPQIRTVVPFCGLSRPQAQRAAARLAAEGS